MKTLKEKYEELRQRQQIDNCNAAELAWELSDVKTHVTAFLICLKKRETEKAFQCCEELERWLDNSEVDDVNFFNQSPP